MRKIMSIIIMVALVMAQSTTAYAQHAGNRFVVDVTIVPPITATVDLSTVEAPSATLTVAVNNVDGSAGSELTWSSVLLGDGWKVSDQYVEVTYNANQLYWGVQVYTDNLGAGVTPRYDGDPTIDPNQQPAGLIGEGNSTLTCPLTVLVRDSMITNASPYDPALTEAENTAEGNNFDFVLPVTAESGTRGDADYVVYFETGYDEDEDGLVQTLPKQYEKTWFWLKDENTTRWLDKDGDGKITLDLDGNGVITQAEKDHADYEIVSDYSGTGDDYGTIVNSRGTSAGWSEQNSGLMLRDRIAVSPICVYVAADFTNAKELQEYTTNTLTLELYHEEAI